MSESNPKHVAEEKQGNFVPESVYRKHLLRAQDRGNWFVFRRDYVTAELFGPHQKLLTLFLQDLINHASMPKTIQDEDGYFLCTTEYLENSLKWDRDTQKEHFKILRERGFVRCQKRGMPPRRWIFVDVLKIETELDVKLSMGGNSPPTEGGNSPPIQGVTPPLQANNKKTTRRKEECRSATPNALPAKGFFGDNGTPCAGWTEILRVAHEAKSGRQIKVNAKSFARSFAGILKRVSSAGRIEAALIHYRDHEIRDRDGRLLIITHPKHFENCLDWIESDMARLSAPARRNRDGYTSEEIEYIREQCGDKYPRGPILDDLPDWGTEACRKLPRWFYVRRPDGKISKYEKRPGERPDRYLREEEK